MPAIHVVAAGDALLAPGVTRRLLDRYARRLPPVAPQVQDAVYGLTQREREVLALAARGPSNTEVAAALKLAPSSVKSHLGHVFAKLNLTSRVQLVIFAHEHGLTTPGAVRPGP